MKAQNLFFIHGGPGLNSYPEENILGQELEKNGLNCYFWNEPSVLRPEGKTEFKKENAYERWKNSLIREISDFPGPVTIVACSFGAIATLHILDEVEDKIEAIYFVSPTIFLKDVFKKMMLFSIEDYHNSDPDKAQALSKFHSETSELYDDAMKRGLELVYSNPALFGHYWVDSNKMGEWASFLAHENYQMDFVSQSAVMEDFRGNTLPKSRFDFSLSIIVGEFDPVSLTEKNLEYFESVFKSVETHVISNTSHFPHVEKTQEFISVLKT